MSKPPKYSVHNLTTAVTVFVTSVAVDMVEVDGTTDETVEVNGTTEDMAEVDGAVEDAYTVTVCVAVAWIVRVTIRTLPDDGPRMTVVVLVTSRIWDRVVKEVDAVVGTTEAVLDCKIIDDTVGDTVIVTVHVDGNSVTVTKWVIPVPVVVMVTSPPATAVPARHVSI